MTTLADAQARLEALKKARDSGALQVRHGDTFTQFRDLSEIEKIIARLETEIANLDGSKRVRGPSYAFQKDKGL